MGWRPLHGLGPCGLACEVFPKVGRMGLGFTRSPNPPLHSALLQSLTRWEPPLARLALLGFSIPTAYEVAGSDLHRACLTRLCCVFGLSQPLDALFLPEPFRLCFAPITLLGFPLQRIPPPKHRSAFRPCSPSRRSPQPSVAREMLPTVHPARCPKLFRARWQECAGDRLVRPQGCERVGDPFFRPLAVRPCGWSRSSLGISALQGFPLACRDAASAASPPMHFGLGILRARDLCSGVSTSKRVGSPLSRLPTLLGFPSSSVRCPKAPSGVAAFGTLPEITRHAYEHSDRALRLQHLPP
jgi:hypothetical protein